MTQNGRVVCLLDVDPDLAEGLDETQRELARPRIRAAVLDLEGPVWDPQSIHAAATPGWLGLLVVDGLMVRRVSIGDRTACELFGPGDVIRPWDADGEYEPLVIDVDWTISRRTRLAVMDEAFARAVGAWPTVVSRIMGRLATRARSLALTLAVSHLGRADARLLIVFWLLAERWGVVGVDGVRITLPLTHEVLAMLIGVRRPAVTLALQRLSRADLLVRVGRDRWVLTNAAMQRMHQPGSIALSESDTGSPASL